MTNKNHPFHLVTLSPWPLLLALTMNNMIIGTIEMLYFKSNILMIYSSLNMILILIQWWRDVIRESTFQGNHTKLVVKGLKIGMILFILSEIFFFFAFFWTYFHNMLSPSIEIGMMWPPKGIKIFNPYSIPLLNTSILLTSGFMVTWSHFSLLNNDKKESLTSLMYTISLGVLFSFIQLYEYYEAPFTISDSVFGSIFFLTTGFHGIHVLIGTIFLTVCYFRMNNNHFSSYHHFGFEAAIWYWHFVDVVWLFLYFFMYWWIY